MDWIAGHIEELKQDIEFGLNKFKEELRDGDRKDLEKILKRLDDPEENKTAVQADLLQILTRMEENYDLQ